MDSVLRRLQQKIAYQFNNLDLLNQALTHRSFGSPNNERLEFLGDSILNCLIAIRLCERFPNLKEGELSRLRASLVRQEGLHPVAENLALGDCLRLGEGERKSGGHRRPSILADAVEALIAAVHLDGGFAAAQELVDRLYAEQLAGLVPHDVLKDPKTALQEWLQARKKPLPDYQMLEVHGEAHSQNFEVACVVQSFGIRQIGRGTSRRAAEQQSAKAALEQLKKS